MPRPLAEYALGDWARLRPLTQGAKSLRYDWVKAAFLRQPPRRGDMAALRAAIAGRKVMAAIAFNDAEILERQALNVRALVAGADYMVVDNSRDNARAAAIEALCGRLAVPYLRLPANPWGPRSPSRSHALALDWTWRNLFEPAGPEAFGFLDHDLVPVAASDPFEPLARQPIHGDKRWANGRWFLWAGYCFYRTEFMRGRTVDFSQDWFVGLDTGGANWRTIYAHIDPASLEERPIERVEVDPAAPVADCYFERRGDWLHEVGFDICDDRTMKRRRFLALLDAARIQAGRAEATGSS